LTPGEVGRARTALVRRKYDRVARYYDLMERMGGSRMDRWRRELWRRAGGLVLEVGVGTGLNFPHHPPGARVVAIDISSAMLDRARRRAREAGVPVRLLCMDAQELAFPDDTFDTVVASCVFCSVPDPVLGLQEVRRVCRPEGRVLLLEHVRSCSAVLGPLMDWLNPVTAWLQGVNINRDTAGNVRRAGLEVLEETNLWRDIFKLIVANPAKR